MPITPAPARATRDLFQWLSYLQYPALAVALVYAVLAGLALGKAAQAGMAPVFDLMNYVLLYAGVGIGLSSLQDPTKTQNEMSRKVWQDPRKGRWMLALLAVYALAVARVTGLIVSDTITEPLRDQLIGWLDDRPATLGYFTAKLIQCPWCTGMWLSGVAAPLVWWWGGSPWLLAKSGSTCR